VKVNIIPIEDVSKTVIKTISEHLKEAYPIVEGVNLEPEVELPSEAYDADRDQYRAEIILQHFSSRFASKKGKILMITSEDLYSLGLNFIFGQAQKPGKFSLISLHRLRPKFWRDEKDLDLFLNRAVKETIHEIGHTLGLDHCEDRNCVMSFSNRIEHTDRKGVDLCEQCEGKIKEMYTDESDNR